MTSCGLTQYTVNLVPAAMQALDRAAELEQVTRTDAANRAILCYADLLEAAVFGEARLVLQLPGGGQAEVCVRPRLTPQSRPTPQ